MSCPKRISYFEFRTELNFHSVPTQKYRKKRIRTI